MDKKGVANLLLSKLFWIILILLIVILISFYFYKNTNFGFDENNSESNVSNNNQFQLSPDYKGQKKFWDWFLDLFFWK